MPRETRGYVPAFIAVNYVMNYYGDHNICPVLTRRPLLTDTVQVTRRVHLQQISDVLQIPIEEIRSLNPQYRRDIIPGNIRPYALILPSQQVYAFIEAQDAILRIIRSCMHDGLPLSRQGWLPEQRYIIRFVKERLFPG